MAIEGEYRIGGPRETVWAALNDVEILKQCIPGCEELVRTSETEIDGRIRAQLGPVRASFGARILLADLNPPASYTLSGEGKAAVGFGKGSARVELIEEEAGTLLRYSATMQLGGKLAQLGSRLVEGATRQLADQFFAAFAQLLDPNSTKVEPAADAPPDAAAEPVQEADTAAQEGAPDGEKKPKRWWKLSLLPFWLIAADWARHLLG